MIHSLKAFKPQDRLTNFFKFEYNLDKLMVDTVCAIDDSLLQTPKSESDSLNQKICRIASSCFCLIYDALSPLNRQIKWLSDRFSTFYFWFFYPRSVPLAKVLQTHQLVDNLSKDFFKISYKKAITLLIESESELLYTAELLTFKLNELQQDSNRSGAILPRIPSKDEILEMMKCHLIASIFNYKILNDTRKQLSRFAEGRNYISQINEDKPDELSRIDDLTFSFMIKMKLNPADYLQTLKCLEAIERSARIGSRIDHLGQIHPQVSKFIKLDDLSSRISFIEQKYTYEETQDTWFKSLNFFNQSERRELFFSAKRTCTTKYSAIGDVISSYHKNTMLFFRKLKSIRIDQFCKESLAVWKIRYQVIPNFFFEIDRKSRQKQLLESYILSVTSLVPELADQKWIQEALPHFEAWQSLAYQIEGSLKHSQFNPSQDTPNYNQIAHNIIKNRIAYEDILYAFIVHHFCCYKYNEGLKDAYGFLRSHFSPTQISDLWLKDTLKRQLCFSDAYTLRILERLQKKPLALMEILQTFYYQKLNHEKTTFEQNFESKALYQRMQAIQTMIIEEDSVRLPSSLKP